MRILFYCTLIFICTHPFVFSQTTKTPAWVREVTFSEEDILEDNGGSQYLLLDNQHHIDLESYFWHVAVKITNSDGVQSMSDISADYDPSYQKMNFHKVIIWRDGRAINKLEPGVIKTIQRETSLERSLYDGSLSSIINLTDVRVGDIIEYSYSVIGYNPVNQGSFSTFFTQQYSIPVNRIFNRIVSRKPRNLNYKLYNGAEEPEIISADNQREWVSDVSGLDIAIYEPATPRGYFSEKTIMFSTYNSWQDIVNWALPLYDLTNLKTPVISSDRSENLSKEDRILNAIRKVQDDVRYLGFESGIGAYVPNPPTKVYSQRFGDCKDKSLLLVSLLRAEGVEAYPMLVNTQVKEDLDDRLPSHAVFDHCVVNFNFDGKDYFVDPTISNQGGNLDEMVFPDYQRGLLIKPGTNDLIEIPNLQKSTTFIKELFTVDSIGGSAGLWIRSEYEGARADEIRSFFSTSTHESIQRDYRDYYRNLYPDIELADDIKFLDYDRSSANMVVVEEFYTIRNFWDKSEDGGYLYCELYPLVLESHIEYAKTGDRDSPYFIGAPMEYEQITEIDLPQDWPVETYNEIISGEGFQYSNSIIGTGQTVSISHVYKRNKSRISGDQIATFLQKHEDIEAELSYYLTYDPDLAEFKVSWLSIVIAFVATGFGLYFAVRAYRHYDPPPWKFAEHKRIGGWLILPAIGLTLAPIRLAIEVFDLEYFDHRLWSNLGELVENSAGIQLLIAAEIGYNYMYFIFTLFVVVLFYQRRTSLPRMITILYIVGIVGPLLDILLVELFLPGQTSQADLNITYTDIGRSVVSAAIWIPYFNIAERVKSTFCIQRNTDMGDDFRMGARPIDS